MAQINKHYAIALEVTLDFACETATPIVRCKQGDNTRYIKIYPLENGEKIITTTEEQTVIIDPTATEVYGGKVTFRVQRPDGAMYEYTYPSKEQGIFEWILSRVEGKKYENVLDYVAFSLSENMLAVEGRALCDVSFELATVGTVSTASFYLDIEAKPTATSSGGLSPSSPINIEEVAEESWGTFTPSSHTLYIVTGENSVKMYFGNLQISGGSNLITRSITSNGTYRAVDDEADGYSQVDVGVPEYNETQTDAVTDAVEEVTQ